MTSVASLSDNLKPKVLDVIGSYKELTIHGHFDLIRRLPIRLEAHRELMEQYFEEPGDYEGRVSYSMNMTSKIFDYGNNFVALKLYDDITRPEIGEYLLSKGWKMIGFTTEKDPETERILIIEKWCNVRDH